MIQKGQALFATWGHLIDALAVAYLKWKNPHLRGLILTSKVPDIDNAQPEEVLKAITLDVVDLFASTHDRNLT